MANTATRLSIVIGALAAIVGVVIAIAAIGAGPKSIVAATPTKQLATLDTDYNKVKDILLTQAVFDFPYTSAEGKLVSMTMIVENFASATKATDSSRVRFLNAPSQGAWLSILINGGYRITAWCVAVDRETVRQIAIADSVAFQVGQSDTTFTMDKHDQATMRAFHEATGQNAGAPKSRVLP